MANEGHQEFTLELCQKKYDKYPAVERKTDEHRDDNYESPDSGEDQTIFEITPEGQPKGEECGNPSEYLEISLGPDNSIFPGCLAKKGEIKWRQVAFDDFGQVVEDPDPSNTDKVSDRFVFEVFLDGPEAECPCIIGNAVLMGNINFGPHYFTHVSEKTNYLYLNIDGKSPGSMPFPGERLAVYAEMMDKNKPDGDLLALGIDGPNCCGERPDYTGGELPPVVANSFNAIYSSPNTAWAFICQTRFETPLFTGGIVLSYTTEKEGTVYEKGRCPSTPDVDWRYEVDLAVVTENVGGASGDLVEMVNELRKSKGLPTLVRDDGLDSVAQTHADYMAEIDEMTHDRPSGTSFEEQVNESSFCSDTNQGPISWSENVAWAGEDAQDPQLVFNGWVNSSSHYNNMINPKWTHIGQGTAVNEDSGNKYYCHDFGECNKKDIETKGNAIPLDFFGPGVGDFVLLLKAGEEHKEPFYDSVIGTGSDNYRICGAQLFFDPTFYSIDDIRPVSVKQNSIIKINDDASVVVDSGEELRLDSSVKYYCKPDPNKYIYDQLSIMDIKNNFLKTENDENEIVIHDGKHIAGFPDKLKKCKANVYIILWVRDILCTAKNWDVFVYAGSFQSNLEFIYEYNMSETNEDGVLEIDRSLIPEDANTLTFILEAPWDTIVPSTCSDNITYSSWTADTYYPEGSIVIPTTPNGHRYEAMWDGTSGSSEPSWPTEAHETVEDDDITWQEFDRSCYIYAARNEDPYEENSITIGISRMEPEYTNNFSISNKCFKVVDLDEREAFSINDNIYEGYEFKIDDAYELYMTNEKYWINYTAQYGDDEEEIKKVCPQGPIQDTGPQGVSAYQYYRVEIYSTQYVPGQSKESWVAIAETEFEERKEKSQEIYKGSELRASQCITSHNYSSDKTETLEFNDESVAYLEYVPSGSVAQEDSSVGDNWTRDGKKIELQMTETLEFNDESVAYLEYEPSEEVTQESSTVGDNWTRDGKKIELSENKTGTLELSYSPKRTGTLELSYSTDYSGSYAFDGSIDSCWISERDIIDSDGSCWIQWDFGEKKTITRMRMAARNDGSYNSFPESIGIFGSNTGDFAGEETELSPLNGFHLSQPSSAGEWCQEVSIPETKRGDVVPSECNIDGEIYDSSPWETGHKKIVFEDNNFKGGTVDNDLTQETVDEYRAQCNPDENPDATPIVNEHHSGRIAADIYIAVRPPSSLPDISQIQQPTVSIIDFEFEGFVTGYVVTLMDIYGYTINPDCCDFTCESNKETSLGRMYAARLQKKQLTEYELTN